MGRKGRQLITSLSNSINTFISQQLQKFVIHLQPVFTSEAQLGLGVQQRLLDLLRLGDVHLQEGEAGGTDPLQLSGSVSWQVQHCGKHLEAQSIQTLCCGIPETRVATCRVTGTRYCQVFVWHTGLETSRGLQHDMQSAALWEELCSRCGSRANLPGWCFYRGTMCDYKTNEAHSLLSLQQTTHTSTAAVHKKDMSQLHKPLSHIHCDWQAHENKQKPKTCNEPPEQLLTQLDSNERLAMIGHSFHLQRFLLL